MRTTMSASAMGLVALCIIGLGMPETPARQEPSAGKPSPGTETQWRGIHIMSPGRGGLPLLKTTARQ